MERKYEIIGQLRSLAMMRPNSWVLRREPAIALLEELEAATDQLAKLKAELDRLAEEG